MFLLLLRTVIANNLYTKISLSDKDNFSKVKNMSCQWEDLNVLVYVCKNVFNTLWRFEMFYFAVKKIFILNLYKDIVRTYNGAYWLLILTLNICRNTFSDVTWQEHL